MATIEKIVPLYDERDNYNPKGRDVNPMFAAGWNAAVDVANSQSVAFLSDPETPLCPVHARLDQSGKLEMTIGGLNCVACSLAEREELLNILAAYIASDHSEDSVAVLRRLADFYSTHAGENRVVISYPAGEVDSDPINGRRNGVRAIRQTDESVYEQGKKDGKASVYRSHTSEDAR